jgi:hypothetical protein
MLIRDLGKEKKHKRITNKIMDINVSGKHKPKEIR